MANKLSLNVTERMYIGSDDNLRKINYVEANTESLLLEFSPVNLLESTLMGAFSWSAHVDKVCKTSAGLRQTMRFYFQGSVYNSLLLACSTMIVKLYGIICQ